MCVGCGDKVVLSFFLGCASDDFAFWAVLLFFLFLEFVDIWEQWNDMESQEVSFTRMPPDSVDETPRVLPLDSRLPPKFQSIKSLPVGLQFIETSHRSKEDEEEVESLYNRSAFFGNFFQDEVVS